MNRILFVENDHFLAQMYQSQLAKRFETVVVHDVQSAVDVLDNDDIDLVITNIQLGNHNGFELIHEMKSYDDWIDIPVIVLSSLPAGDYPTAPALWRRYGAMEFLYQPRISSSILTAKIDQLLGE